MGLMDLFFGTSDQATKRGLDTALDRRITQAVENGDAKTLQKLRAAPDTILSNGETVATYALKIQMETYEAYGKACRDFQNDDDGFHDKVATIMGKAAGLTPPGHYLPAVARLSSRVLLDRLKIPYEQRPDAVIDDDFTKAANAFYPKLNETFLRCSRAAETSALFTDRATQPNELGETPQSLLEDCRKTLDRQLIYVTKTTDAMRDGAELLKVANDPVSAKLFIDYARDEKLKINFSWLVSYKPDEATFLDTFSPGWRQRAASTDTETPGDDATEGPAKEDWFDATAAYQEEERKKRDQRKQLQEEVNRHRDYIAARELGFYDWQSKRFTIEVAKIIELDKQLKRDAMLEQFRNKEKALGQQGQQEQQPQDYSRNENPGA